MSDATFSTIALKTDAKVTGSSPSFKIRRGSAESTQKGGTGRFALATIFAHREPCLESFRVVIGLREDNRRVSSHPALGTLGMHHICLCIWMYHFDDEPFIHPLHSVRFDPDRPYELPIESLLALRHRDSSKGKDPSPQRFGPSRRASPALQYSPLSPVSQLGSPPSFSKMVPPTQDLEGARPLKSWELIPPSEGWMCEVDEAEGKEVSGGISARVDEAKGIEEEDKKDEEGKEEDPEEDPSEEEMPAIPRAMDMDADKGYLQYLEELRRHPEYSPVHSSQAFAQNRSDDAQSPPFDARSHPSFDLSSILAASSWSKSVECLTSC
ncbi:hypothetical protein PIB30_088749 [Stylosanthes scabra]|uniref:Uncharacterized protein n=1 Tax=Stylosanthes scabra TaxID=79078 RepID=A0ABU6YS10_9FABA|nr:hypothetical protein [Stylosanthes scabra]